VTSSSTSARNAPVAVTAALIVLGVLFVVTGVIYLARTEAQLPAFFPGHQAGSAHHHTKHALVAFALAVVCWIGAWLSTGRRTRRNES
jgi:NADH:ubiquinone oxidoreductase subunit 5 (subunit L)/multisubunit Na+/H+ antiporter MnhA subunit